MSLSLSTCLNCKEKNMYIHKVQLDILLTIYIYKKQKHNAPGGNSDT